MIEKKKRNVLNDRQKQDLVTFALNYKEENGIYPGNKDSNVLKTLSMAALENR
jgi:hypothetical protein